MAPWEKPAHAEQRFCHSYHPTRLADKPCGKRGLAENAINGLQLLQPTEEQIC